MAGAITALAAAALGQFQYLGYQYEVGNDRPLATPPPYVFNRAMNWAHVEEVGRPWESRIVVAGVYDPQFPWGEPGPAYYGAEEFSFPLYWGRIGNLVVPASPWIRVPGPAFDELEEARQIWLREEGYVARPRVFRNPMYEIVGEREPVEPVEPVSLRDRYEWRKLKILVPQDPSFEVRGEPNRPQVFLALRHGESESRRVVVRRGISEGAVVVRGAPTEGRVIVASR